MDYEFLVIWQFRVRAGMEAPFQRIYGPQGDWAQLFRTGAGYLRTELNRSLTDPQVFVTLDFWTSQHAYDRFRGESSAGYDAIDARCEALTISELELGRFAPVRRTAF